jgi:hypothetical protein
MLTKKVTNPCPGPDIAVVQTVTIHYAHILHHKLTKPSFLFPQLTDTIRQHCARFAVALPNVFYEITYSSRKLLFEESLSNQTLKRVEVSFGVHVWNWVSSGQKITVRSKATYGLLAQKHCPRVYSKCGLEF